MRPCTAAAVLLAASVLCHAADKAAPAAPQAGQTFYFSPANPKYVTCDIEFRHPDEKLWPCFFYGRPAEGTFQYDPNNPKAAFTIVCDKMCQPHADQSRKVLGELVKPDKAPVVTFTVKGLTPQASSPKPQAAVDAILDVDGRKLPVKAAGSLKYESEKGSDAISQVRIVCAFAIQGADLGLKAEDAKGPLSVRVEMLGTTTKEAPEKKRK